MGLYRKMLAKMMDMGMPEFEDKPGEETTPEEKARARQAVIDKLTADDEDPDDPAVIARKKRLKEQPTWED